MKTKEEIEKMADDRCLQKTEDINDSIIKGYIASATKGGFIDGYTQCLQDMETLHTELLKLCQELKDSHQLLINTINTDGEPNIINDIIDWQNIENELMDWSHELGIEQKYTPYPAQVLEWLKKNYNIPTKKR